MNIPFSMSDEPDLGDEFKSLIQEHDDEVEAIGYSLKLVNPALGIDKPIYTDWDMKIVIQRNLNSIREYQNELAEAWESNARMIEALHDIQDWNNHGTSRHALQILINRGLDN